ncbi:hypothetical protein F5876DRAFT_67230 [Lentinula aff. lateritia]|uniref:Uncharacterized protein n=1 Tax=Lentinula aff. lateritia TaxID=2804960 RepID=A0ACC1TVX5_9AGAR|nr:hypothetical protein F5876DRAFT_67230 [Lentinula aff. lateritia]
MVTMLVLEGIIVEDKLLLAGRRTVVGDSLNPNSYYHALYASSLSTTTISAQYSLALMSEHNCILTMYGTKQKCKIFKPHQIQVLNTALEKWNNYPLHEIKKQLAKELSLTNQQVKTWFQVIDVQCQQKISILLVDAEPQTEIAQRNYRNGNSNAQTF